MEEVEATPQVILWAGAMSSGKTSALYSEMNRLAAMEVNFLAVQPDFDARGAGMILPKTHVRDGQIVENGPNCLQVRSLLDIGRHALRGANVLVVDEFTLFGFDEDGQPIDGYYDAVMNHLGRLGVTTVVASGLSIAANGRMFPMLQQALEHGADVRMLHASCMARINGKPCARDARQMRIVSRQWGRAFNPKTLPMLLPEGNYDDLMYEPVCPHCAHNFNGVEHDSETGAPVLLEFGQVYGLGE